MLDIIRKKSSSWVTRTVFLVIIIVFVGYFGWSSVRQGLDGTDDFVAKVDDIIITQSMVDNAAAMEIQNKQQALPGQPPPPPLSEQEKQQIRLSTKSRLIQDAIIQASAYRIGFRISDQELLDTIVKDPFLQVEGKFDPERYKNLFKPMYYNQTGRDYEDVMREELLSQKAFDLFRDTIFVSKQMKKNNDLINNTKFKLQMLELNPIVLAKDFKPSDEEIAKKAEELKTNPDMAKIQGEKSDDIFKQLATTQLKKEEGLKIAKEIATTVTPLFNSGSKKLNSTLKKYSLALKDLPPWPMSGLEKLFRNSPNVDQAVIAILKLTDKNPVFAEPMEVGGSLYLVKLLSRTTEEPKEEASESHNEKILENQLSNLFLQTWYRLAYNQTKIAGTTR